MRRAPGYLPIVGLIVATAALFFAGASLREPPAVQHDRQARQSFAASVQRGERPRIAVRNMAGVLRQELDSQAADATHRARAAMWAQGAAVFCLFCVGASALTRTGVSRGKTEALVA
jgi:hypothetical protein